MNEQFFKSISVIKAAIAERKLVVFAGAGISIDAGVPSWGDLMNELKKDIEISDSESDYLRIAQLYYNERQQKEFVDKIREFLKHKRLRYNDLHQSVFGLNPEHIITTNFDDLLEQVIKSKAYPYSIVKKDAEFPYARNTKLLVKIHGDLDDSDFIIKEDDYLDYPIAHPLFESFIKGIFSTKIVLFVGYSFSDLDLKLILHRVRNILGKDFQYAYMLNVDEDLHPSQRQYLHNKGINVIHYNDAGKLNSDSYINQYLFVGRNALNKTIPTVTNNLSEKGNRLLKLLLFIKEYNVFEETIAKENVLSQMHKSLDRFASIRVLPPKLLGNLYPFNIRSGYLHNYEQFTLGSNNSKVTRFFSEEIDNQTLRLNDKFFENNDISFDKRTELDNKLVEVLQKLNYSSIFNIGKSVNQEINENITHFSEIIRITLPNRHCDCMACKYNAFKLKDFLKNIKEQTITETSDLQADLLFAYSNYKAGNVKTAILQFEEIGNKAWQLEEYIIYFISQHNVIILKFLLRHDFEDLSNEVRRALAKRIEELNLDKLMFQIPKLTDDVYNLLKAIRDDEILLSAERNINELFDKIVDVYERYKRNGIVYGPYYPELIIEELLRTFLFYTYNYIVKDDYTEYKRVFQKAIDALLISNSIDKRYGARYTEVDSWMVRFILLYGNDDKMAKIIKWYTINSFNVQQGQIDEVIGYLNNLFESLFNINTFPSQEIYIDSHISYQSNNFFFQQKLRVTIHNAFLLYSLIEIPIEHGTQLVKNLLYFLKVELVLINASQEYFNKFLENVINLFTVGDIIELLKISSIKGFLIRSSDFFIIIADAIKKYHFNNLISETDTIRTIVQKSIDRDGHKHTTAFMYLWSAVNDECKQIISSAIREDLSFKFDYLSYLNACYQNIIEPNEYFKEALIEVQGHMPQEFKTDGERNIFSNLVLRNFLFMIYEKGLINDEVPYNNFEELPNYVKFYFRPFKFEYSKFDVNWLLPLNKNAFFHLKNIPQIKAQLEQSLSREYNEKLSEIYTRFYIGTQNVR